MVNDGAEVVMGDKGGKKDDQKGQRKGKRWGWKDGSTLYQSQESESQSEVLRIS